MPLYEYKCDECGRITEAFFHLNEIKEMIDCSHCFRVARKIISKTQDVKPCWEEYYDENLECVITGRGHRREIMKQQGLEDKYIDPSKIRVKLEEREHKKREKENEHAK